jgi:hypothetical protein
MSIEAKEIFEAESQSVRKLLSEPGVGFYIPPYQRPYAWSKDKVDRLFDDSMNGFRKLIDRDESFTFLGTIITIHDRDHVTIQPVVKTDVPGKVLNVIDGQQRLTTLLLMCVALHNQIRLLHAKIMKTAKGVAPDPSTPLGWLDGQTLQVLAALKETFVQIQPHGTSRLYPRMIRAFSDQWSRDKNHATYLSPISHLISAYSIQVDAAPHLDFKPGARQGPIEGEDALVARFLQIIKSLKGICSGLIDEEIGEFPSINEILGSKVLQKSLLNHEFPKPISEALAGGQASEDFKGLLRLVLFACYTLDRIAVTVVKGKNEDYAFSVFESLNTTGEPLTAFETFRPRVVSAEDLALYEKSASRQFIDEVADYLSGFKAGDPLQNGTRDLLVAFASAETGERNAKRLPDQRRYMKDEYERYEKDASERLLFARHLRDTAMFMQHAWVPKGAQPAMHGLPVQATSDAIKLCLAFLSELGHTMTIGALVRFYSAALSASPESQGEKVAEFESVIKAITAFSVFWRASRRGTANIDQQYRDIMTGNNSVTMMAPLARSLQLKSTSTLLPGVSAAALKVELRERLQSDKHGKIANKATWINDAATIPAYQNNKQISRFILLAAYHDAVEDDINPGLISLGKEGVSPCLTYEGWCDDKHLSLEHIAPKDTALGWMPNIYDNRELIHQIGNLVLVPSAANSSLGNRPWKQKRILYAALGAKTKQDATLLLDQATKSGIEFALSTQALVELSAHIPHLAALGAYPQDWSIDAISERSKCLLDLAWDRLWTWLN